MSNCVFCLIELNSSNKTEEHVLPASLGGTLVSTNLICVKCNSRLGEQVDSVLAKSLSLLIVAFGIRNARDPKKDIPPLTFQNDAGRKLQFKVGTDYVTIAKQEFRKEVEGDLTHISLTVPAGDKAEHLLEQHRKDITQHYGIENVVREYTDEERLEAPPAIFHPETLNDDIDFKRAIAKIAFMFACCWIREHGSQDPDYADIRAYVEGNSTKELVVCFPAGIADLLRYDIPPHHFLAFCMVEEDIWVYGLLFGGISFLVRVATTHKDESAYQDVIFIFNPEARNHHFRTDLFFSALFESIRGRVAEGAECNDAERMLGLRRIGHALKGRGLDIRYMSPEGDIYCEERQES